MGHTSSVKDIKQALRQAVLSKFEKKDDENKIRQYGPVASALVTSGSAVIYFALTIKSGAEGVTFKTDNGRLTFAKAVVSALCNGSQYGYFSYDRFKDFFHATPQSIRERFNSPGKATKALATDVVAWFFAYEAANLMRGLARNVGWNSQIVQWYIQLTSMFLFEPGMRNLMAGRVIPLAYNYSFGAIIELAKENRFRERYILKGAYKKLQSAVISQLERNIQQVIHTPNIQANVVAMRMIEAIPKYNDGFVSSATLEDGVGDTYDFIVDALALDKSQQSLSLQKRNSDSIWATILGLYSVANLGNYANTFVEDHSAKHWEGMVSIITNACYGILIADLISRSSASFIMRLKDHWKDILKTYKVELAIAVALAGLAALTYEPVLVTAKEYFSSFAAGNIAWAQIAATILVNSVALQLLNIAYSNYRQVKAFLSGKPYTDKMLKAVFSEETKVLIASLKKLEPAQFLELMREEDLNNIELSDQQRVLIGKLQGDFSKGDFNSVNVRGQYSPQNARRAYLYNFFIVASSATVAYAGIALTSSWNATNFGQTYAGYSVATTANVIVEACREGKTMKDDKLKKEGLLYHRDEPPKSTTTTKILAAVKGVGPGLAAAVATEASDWVYRNVFAMEEQDSRQMAVTTGIGVYTMANYMMYRTGFGAK